VEDVQYLGRIRDRAAGLQRKEIVIRQDISHTQHSLVRVSADIELELEALRNEIVTLEHIAHQTVGRVRAAVFFFKNVAKRADLVRLQQRSDAWAPQEKITKEQFGRMLED
jgi:hypothetical protein